MTVKRQPEPALDPLLPPAPDATTIVAVAAHELKNALGGIGMALARCEQRVRGGGAVGLEDLGAARVELRRLSMLVNDLLDGARVDLGMISIAPAIVDVAALGVEVAAAFEETHRRRVAVQLPPSPLVIEADGERVRAVLVNYLENADKYAPAPAPIALVIDRAPGAAGGVRLAVRDGGPGIAPADQQRLFQRFFRAPTVAKCTRGLGLGLYICRAIAEAHGGSVGVHSAPGAGATFWVDLPARAAHLSPPEPTPISTPVPE